MTEQAYSRLSWDNVGIGVRNHQGDITFHAHDSNQDHDAEQALLPPLTDDIHGLDCIYLPMEQVLSRAFSFPLKHRRYLDADMLGQELADTAGINPDDWWLSWRSDKSNDGIAGIVFGLSTELKHAMQNNPIWQQAPLLLIDGWERLQQWLPDEDKSQALLVIDTDADGVFFGLIQDGAWQGMRRLNADMNAAETGAAIAQQVLWSLQAMGLNQNETHVVGRLTTQLAEVFPLAHPEHPPLVESALPQRHILNFMLPNPASAEKSKPQHLFNIRHGQWAAKRGSHTSHVWYRPALLAACLCFLWLTTTVYSNIQLEKQLSHMNDALTAAFHRGLPDQPVIIDALAQLRQAAKGNASGDGNNAQHVTKQLSIISAVYAQHPWRSQDLKMDKDGVLLAGKVNTLKTLNIIRGMLAQKTATDVQIADTDLKGDEVSFRLRWQ